MPLTSCLDIEEDTSNFIAFIKKTIYLMSTLREESNAEKSPVEQKKAKLKNASLVQNWHSFIPHFLNHSHNLHSLIPHFSGILDHSQSFTPHFLNSRLHFFQCIFLCFKEICHSLCKATLSNESNRK